MICAFDENDGRYAIYDNYYEIWNKVRETKIPDIIERCFIDLDMTFDYCPTDSEFERAKSKRKFSDYWIIKVVKSVEFDWERM